MGRMFELLAILPSIPVFPEKKTTLISSSPNLVVPSFMQCCQRLRFIKNILSLFMVYICHWQHCKNDTKGHMGKRKNCKDTSTGCAINGDSFH